MDRNVLFISHKKKQCGVYEFGRNIAEVIKKSSRYNFIYQECDSLAELHQAIALHNPIAIIYNYYNSTLPWLTKKVIHTYVKPTNKGIMIPQIGIMHEVTQEKADKANELLFNYHIAPDPTLLLQNPIVFKTGRLIPRYTNKYETPSVPVIGSFGFATPNKGFEDIVNAVQAEFDTAVIRFNIPSADFGDPDGSKAASLVSALKNLVHKPGITLQVTHDYMSGEQVLDFLAQNTINVFLYKDKTGRGVSSTADYALAVDRPLAVSDSIMFRHLFDIQPSVIYGKMTIKEIIQNGTAPLRSIQLEWSDRNMIWEYERIMDAILKIEEQKKNKAKPSTWKQLKTRVRFVFGMGKSNNAWLRNTDQVSEDNMDVVNEHSYTPIDTDLRQPLNRILDNSARQLYKPAIHKLEELVPRTMAKKIAEANVQQAFVFDTVYSLIQKMSSPKILCVGSYEDTAAMSLKKLGIQLDEIDPVLNFSLQEYASRPTTVQQSYDIIFSTSVIEHDPDDESFAKCISDLLAQGGVAVLTCDYNDQWKTGDPKPEVDARLYTQKDLRNRLLPIMTGCELVDKPQWDCPNPDFTYLGKYQYTFATFVVKKSKTV